MYDYGVPDVPSGKVVFMSCNVDFYVAGVEDQIEYGKVTVDGRALMIAPAETIFGAAISAGINLKFEDLKFVDPDDGKPPLEDWQIPNAVIGPPLASIPGGFVYKYTGDAEGKEYTGPSGKRYKLTKFSVGFASFYYWKLV